MADISDITAYLAQTAADACYPNGTSQPSIANMDIIIYEGWPLAETLDLDLTGQMEGPDRRPVPRPGGKRANVSIFPMQGTNTPISQILDETYVVTPAVFGLTAIISQNPTGSVFTITLTGIPGATEFLTIDIDNKYVASSGGSTNTAILNSLAAAINAFPSITNPLVPGYTAIVAGNTLTITGAAYCIPRLGAQGTLGKVIHNQRQSIMITVWAPDHVSRTKIAAAIDILIKKRLVVTMPDTSMALICYNRTNITDEHEPVACYRRDLIVLADYATVELFPGTVITSVTTEFAALDTQNQNFIGVTTVTSAE